MVKLRADNAYTHVEYNASDRVFHQKIYNILRNTLSYEVPNANFSDKYKTGAWDGKISVYDGKNKKFPSGLTDFVKENLEKLGIKSELIDDRKKPTQNAKYTANYGSRELRDYQVDGPDLVSTHTRGILAYGTGSGKTLTLCEILTKLSCSPVCVIVPGISLLRQTAKEIEDTIKNHGKSIKVGRIGGGMYDIEPEGINVCVYHSALAAYNIKFLESKNSLVYDEFAGETIRKTVLQLKEDLVAATKSNNPKLIKKIEGQIATKTASQQRKIKLQQLIQSCQVLVVDECHIAAETIEFISLKSESAYYKIGLSATPWRQDNQEIRIEGSIGRILKEVSSSELIARKYLCKPTVLMFKIQSRATCSGYQDCYTANIINNEYRNGLIKKFAEECHANNIPTAILVERIDHGKILQDLIKNSTFVPGKEKGDEDPTDKELDYRKRMLNRLANNEHIMIATQWLNVGVDCPPMQCLILAGSVSSSITTYQQIGRVLRLSPETNKQFALVIDFYDDNKYLNKHAATRKKTYKLEPEWDLKIISPL